LSASSRTEDGPWSAGERELTRLVALWPDCVESAASERAPEKIADFVSQMARATRELSRNNAPSLAPTSRRLELLRASGNVATNALKILGIDANERF
jgi:arginyl-tRNA synthetase